MSDFLRLLIAFLATVNPAGVAAALRRTPDDGPPAPASAVIGAGVAIALAAAAAFGADSLLDALEIEPETFRTAAGIVMFAVGVTAIWFGRVLAERPEPGWAAGIFPIGVPLLLGPATLIAVVSYGADEGEVKTVVAAGVAILVAAALSVAGFGRWRAASDGLARVTGALLVAIAAGLIVSGVRDI